VVQACLAVRAEAPVIRVPMAILLRTARLRCAEIEALPQLTPSYGFAPRQLFWRHALLDQPRPKDVPHGLQAAS
jgi:hypothetical protein